MECQRGALDFQKDKHLCKVEALVIDGSLFLKGFFPPSAKLARSPVWCLPLASHQPTLLCSYSPRQLSAPGS